MTETDSEGESVKVAGSLSAEFMVSVQVLALPLRAPPQPVKIQPLAGVSVKVTSVPESKAALQVVGQLTPLGELVTVPPSAAAPVGGCPRRQACHERQHADEKQRAQPMTDPHRMSPHCCRQLSPPRRNYPYFYRSYYRGGNSPCDPAKPKLGV